MTTLDRLVRDSARRAPSARAVKAGDDVWTYGEFDEAADAVAVALLDLGVKPGDRVGVWLEKGTQAVAAMQGALRAGAAYVPIDPLSPRVRAQTIMADCSMAAVVSDVARTSGALVDELAGVASICVDGRVGAHGARSVSWDDAVHGKKEPPPHARGPGDLAYILYTSGSTGTPKGVCISHENALAFVCWSAEVLGARADDVFSSHAPFHFDLSVLDLYAAFLVGGCVTIIPETLSYIPAGLVDFVASERPSIWYSVPSALTLMMQHGLADLADLPMRSVCFAGEPWPIGHLRAFRARFPQVRLLNLYGPTETNVCTWYEVRETSNALGERTKPVPIGRASCGDEVWAVKEDGARAAVGEKGELHVAGPTVMLGYWGKEPQGKKPYATGDIVLRIDDHDYEYVGRRDHMVKLRGYRVELGDVEAALLQHAGVRGAAAVVTRGEEPKLVAFLEARDGAAPSLLELKRHCAERLPRYMVVDRARLLDALPRTRNGKIDRLALQDLADRGAQT